MEAEGGEDDDGIARTVLDRGAAGGDGVVGAAEALIDRAEVGLRFVDVEAELAGAFELGDGSGQRFLRFEEFETDNGPDLNVYLVNSSAGGINDFVDLGNLKGNIGDQNYEIPADTNLDVYDTVLIWCVRFSSPFGEATLSCASPKRFALV